MNIKDSLDGYDYELPLMDALADPALPVRRRLLAGATVGIGLDIAHFAVSEMAEGFWLLKDETERGKNCGEGYLMVEAMLEEKNAFQMRLWHLLDETPLNNAAYDLALAESPHLPARPDGLFGAQGRAAGDLCQRGRSARRQDRSVDHGGNAALSVEPMGDQAISETIDRGSRGGLCETRKGCETSGVLTIYWSSPVLSLSLTATP